MKVQVYTHEHGYIDVEVLLTVHEAIKVDVGVGSGLEVYPKTITVEVMDAEADGVPVPVSWWSHLEELAKEEIESMDYNELFTE